MCFEYLPSSGLSRTYRKLSGLTLIELLMAISLVSILAAVAIPSFMAYRDRTLVKTAVQDIVVISAAIRIYEGDVGGLPASLAEVGMAGKLDPWGREYIYYNVADGNLGPARKDRSLNPINTDFDLYSVGPDGETKKQVSQKDSADDVIRGRNGNFFGVAADF